MAYDRDGRAREEVVVAAVIGEEVVVVDRETAVFAAARTTLVVAEDLRIMARSNPPFCAKAMIFDTFEYGRFGGDVAKE